MNGKKAGWAFLITTVGYICISFVAAFYIPSVAESLLLSNILCELVVVLPILIFIIASKEKLGTFLEFHKIKISSVLMIGLFTFLSLPLLSLLNLISQIWVENEVAATLISQQEKSSFVLMYLSVGIIAPVFEEIACRGAFYRSYRKSGSVLRAMLLSALIFAFMHMNFNQAAYAFAMGILSVLLVEATGSLWSSILYHGIINGSQVILLYGALGAASDVYSEQAAVTTDLLICAIAVYLIITAVTLPLAWAVLVWIGRNEGRSGVLSGIWLGRKEKKDKMITVPFVLALILCISIMTGTFVMLIINIQEMIA